MATMHGMELLAKLGMISRHDVLEKRNQPNLVDYRVQDGSLIKVYPGVYRFRGAPDSWESRAFAATLYGGAGSAVSHFAAAFLHGLEGFKQPTTLDLLVPHGVQIRPPGVHVHRTREPFQIYLCNGIIPTTSMARTLVDLAPRISELQLEIALNSAWRKQRTIAAWLRWYFGTLKRNDWRKLEPLIEMVRRLDGGGLDSGLEVYATRQIADDNLPAPERGVIIRDDHGKYVIKADLAWLEARVVGHVDGFAYHSPERAMVRDAMQRSELSLLKWTQIIIMARTIRQGLWLQQLRRALGR